MTLRSTFAGAGGRRLRRSLRDRSGRVSAETVTAIAATVTAVAALVVAVWDNVQTREYNRVSVQPHLVLEFSKQQSDDRISGELWLRNEGIGPGVIDEIRITLKDDAGQSLAFGSWKEARDMMRAGGLTVSGCADLTLGSVIGIERGIDILSVRADDPPTGADPVQSLIDRLEVGVRYTSVWGVPYEASWPRTRR